MRAVVESAFRRSIGTASMRYVTALRSWPSPPEAEPSCPVDCHGPFTPIKEILQHVSSTITPATIRLLSSAAGPQGSDPSGSWGGPDPLPEDLWWWSPRKAKPPVWKHTLSYNANRKKLLHPHQYVEKFKPFVCRVLFGENWLTDVATASGIHLLSGMPLLLADMQMRGVSFYNPPTPDSFRVDEFGNFQVAEGVLLRRATRISLALDLYFSADATANILTHAPHRKVPVKLPNDFLHLLRLMKTPWLPCLYLMVIHPSGFPIHQRRPALLKAFELLHIQLPKEVRSDMLQAVIKEIWSEEDGKSWIQGVKRSLLLKQFFYDPEYGKQYGNDDVVSYQRNCDCRVFAHMDLLRKYGFPYNREDYDDALHCEKSSVLPEIYGQIWGKFYDKFMILKPELHICRAGLCCPMEAGCFRRKLFDHSVRCLNELDDNDEWQALLLRVVSSINRYQLQINEDETKMLQDEGSSLSIWDRYKEKSYINRTFGKVVVDFIGRNYNEISVKCGDDIEIISQGKFINTKCNKMWVNPPNSVLHIVRRGDRNINNRWFYVSKLVHGAEEIGLVPAWCARKI